MKKIPSVLIIIISIAAVYYLLVAPAFCRGTVKITVENTTSERLLIIAINDKEVNQSVKPKGRTTINYKVDSCPYILLEFDSTLLSDPMDLEVVTYIEPMYYGTAFVTASYDEKAGAMVFQTQNNIRF